MPKFYLWDTLSNACFRCLLIQVDSLEMKYEKVSIYFNSLCINTAT